MSIPAQQDERARLDYDSMKRNAADAVSLLKGLANESRLMIMCVLAEGKFLLAIEQAY